MDFSPLTRSRDWPLVVGLVATAGAVLLIGIPVATGLPDLPESPAMPEVHLPAPRVAVSLPDLPDLPDVKLPALPKAQPAVVYDPIVPGTPAAPVDTEDGVAEAPVEGLAARWTMPEVPVPDAPRVAEATGARWSMPDVPDNVLPERARAHRGHRVTADPHRTVKPPTR